MKPITLIGLDKKNNVLVYRKAKRCGCGSKPISYPTDIKVTELGLWYACVCGSTLMRRR